MPYTPLLPTLKYGNSTPTKTDGRKRFLRLFFEGAMLSKGAFTIIDKTTDATIGSTRFYDYNMQESSIFIGYTFYATAYWGTGINKIVKALMLDYIFQFVEKVHFHIGADNIRSQIAISRIGAVKIAEQEVRYFGEATKLNFVYEITKQDWRELSDGNSETD